MTLRLFIHSDNVKKIIINLNNIKRSYGQKHTIQKKKNSDVKIFANQHCENQF